MGVTQREYARSGYFMKILNDACFGLTLHCTFRRARMDPMSELSQKVKRSAAGVFKEDTLMAY